MASPRLKLVLPPQTWRYALVIRFVVENVTELSVGGSTVDLVTGGTSDNVVAKTYAKVVRNGSEVYEIVPFIPASTLKGAFRSLYEEYLKTSNPGSVSLVDVLKKFVEIAKNRRIELTEVIDKLVSKIYLQYIDENIVNALSRTIRSREKFEEFINALHSNDEDKLAKFIIESSEGSLPQEAAKELAKIMMDVSHSYRLYPYVCDPVIEGIACELPVPTYKALIRTIVAELCGVNEVEYPCKACRLFGLPGYMSRIVVTDAWPQNVDEVAILTRTHIAIDRIRGSVVQGKTYQVEYVAPGARFEFYIVYKMHSFKMDKSSMANVVNVIKRFIEDEENDKPDVKGLEDLDKEFLAMLKELVKRLKNEGLQIGRKKTLNYGLIKHVEYDIKIIDVFERTMPISIERKEGTPIPLLDLRSTYGFER